jgi:hypothetical protein
MTTKRRWSKSNTGQARILEAVVAATIVFLVFSASSILINGSRVTATQERADLNTLGYNVLSRLIEAGTIEATIEKASPPLTQTSLEVIELKASLQNSLPSSMFFSITITNNTKTDDGSQTANQQLTVGNAEAASFSASTDISSTPLIYTSKSGNNYFIVLVLANVGGQGS